MSLRFHDVDGVRVAECTAEGVAIRTPQDALDLMMTASYDGADRLVLQASQLAPAFFELRSGLAGEIAQKGVNYGLRLAIVGDFDGVTSEALRAFIRESNRGPHLAFVPDFASAFRALTGTGGG